MSKKSLQKVKIEMRAKSTLKRPSITYSRQHDRLLLLYLETKIILHIIDYRPFT